MMNLDQARCNWRTQTSGSNWIDKSFRRDTLFPGAISRPADAESGAIVDAIMDVIKQALAAWKAGLQARLVAVALFGSRARGEERPGSDWDLFVLAESLPQDPLDRQLYLKSMLPLWPASKVSVLAKTPAEFEKELLSVYLDIAADGVLIFDPHKYLGPTDWNR